METSASITLIFLFTDLEGSTRLWQQYPEAMKQALARHDEIIGTAVERFNGRVVKTTGDGFHAVFQNAADGLRACVEVQRDLIAEDWGETGPLRVRMGMHLGEAQHRAGDYYGTAVNRAARLMSAANGGQVLLSEAVATVLAGQMPQDVSLRDLGEHLLKDLQRAERIFQLVHPDLPADFPAIASLSERPNNLPSQPTIFVGREKELREINDRLAAAEVRLLTLLGPGGTGKTRLALQSGAELVDHFADGTYFVDLAPVRDPNAVLTTIARTIGVRESSAGSIQDDLTRHLREKELLLLLDNFEQVTAAAVAVAVLLQHCPRLKILVTSREALHVRGEYLYPVPPLGLPQISPRRLPVEDLLQFESIRLFIARAQAVKPGFELTVENAQDVAELCLRLDGLPLAIELAAARLRHFSPQRLRRRLDNRLNLLRGGARDLPERQQTLRDTIAWSYELLAEPEKRLLEVVSVFSGATFEAVEAVTAEISLLSETGLDVFDGLTSLVDKSLIRLADNSDGEPQLRMLETIREFAVECLQETPQLYQQAHRAHANYFADFARQQWRRMTGFEQEEALADMTAAVENLKTAWAYWIRAADLDLLQKMADPLWLLYERRGWYQDTIDLSSQLLNVLSTTTSTPEKIQQEIMLQTSLARAQMALRGYTPEVEAIYKHALKLTEESGEVPQMFPVLRGLASYYIYRAEFAKSSVLGERILALAEIEDDDLMRMHGYIIASMSATTFATSDLHSALEHVEQGVRLFDPRRHRLQPYYIGNNPGIVCHTLSAFFLYWLGYPDRAVSRSEEAINLAGLVDHPYTTTYAWFHTGILHMWMNDVQRAQKHALAMAEIAGEHEYTLWIALSIILQGAVQTALGRTVEGIAQLERGIESYLGHNSPPIFWPELTGLRAIAYGQAGEPHTGLKLIAELVQQTGVENAMSLSPNLAMNEGELLMITAPDEAFGLFTMLLENARAAGANIFALKAATQLCRLELLAGEVRASGQVLADIYGSFTEGFETADLLEAQAVLQEWQNTL